jgi:hypothetical protein
MQAIDGISKAKKKKLKYFLCFFYRMHGNYYNPRQSDAAVNDRF